ncbi:NADPH-dependent pterin aldehyde reductase [Cryptomeria japonica]|uniref:NADPH-dependent pterin aldehyde reductase n=1 Tax=Cryptomeria japonica TaxID=3369 RepID=UPI0025ACA757|nr:NADPH-dependent pterin aldehyde reductase [Cryptomeria japonica]
MFNILAGKDKQKEKGTMPKLVLITGVSKGLGRVLAMELASRGHTLVGCARNEQKLSTLRSQISAQYPSSTHLFHPVDVSSDSSVREFAKLVIEIKGVPDIIVNNAGIINKNGKLWEIPAEEFDSVIDINLKGTANMLRHFLPHMIAKKRGIVVNLSSGWGRSAAGEVSPYCASKWAIEGLTKSVAKEIPQGMAVIALSPGVINTDLLASCFGASAALYQSPEAWAPHAATTILGLTAADNGASLNV